ncbi:MAG TPA: hypothetical protein VHF06_15710 [Pseudonocardiaceae bacterium]|nr:hypothetical protein [Pseudonocardiaceae bacterium]
MSNADASEETIVSRIGGEWPTESDALAADGTEEITPLPEPRRRRFRPARVALWVLVVVPVAVQFAEALRAPRLNFNDFWYVLGTSTSADGALRPDKLFTLYQGQPAVLPTVVFWLDAKLFAGSNNVLGVCAVLLGIVLLAALASMLPVRLTGTRRTAVLAGLALLVFSSAATEYYGIGMMGTWWLLGLACSGVALAFAHRGWTVPAVLFGVLASLSHGVGLVVWPALAVVAWLRAERLWRVVLPLVLGVAAFVGWSLLPQPPEYPAPAILGVDSYVGAMLKSLGQIWSEDSVDLAIIAGVVTAGVLVALLWPALRRAEPTDFEVDDRIDDAGWFGLAVQILLAAVLIGVTRGRLGDTEPIAPRYAGIALLAVCAVLVLLAVRGPDGLRARIVPVALVLGIGAFGTGNAWATVDRDRYPTQPVLAVAMRVDAAPAITQLLAYPRFVPVLRAMHVYPFTSDFTLGCGGPELGTRIDLRAVKPLPLPGSGGTSGVVETGPVDGGVVIGGWAQINGQAAGCVLVTDAAGTVVGGGAVGLPRADVSQKLGGTGRAGWQAVARPGLHDGVILVRADGRYYRVASAPGK